MNRGSARRPRLPALLAALLWLTAILVTAAAAAQTSTTFTLKRDDTELLITNLGRAADGARSIGNNRNCEEEHRLTIVYAPAPGWVETRVRDALLTSSLAVIRAPTRTGAENSESGGDSGEPHANGAENAGQELAANEESLELTDSTVTFDRPGCIEERLPAESPRVTLIQGRTEVVGTRFYLGGGADEGLMDGPVTLERATEGGEPLTAEAEGMTFLVNEQRATLRGGVQVTSEERVTTGDALELNEEAGTALMLGEPARSVKGDDVLEGKALLYYLDSDDVVVIGNVTGEIELDLD